MLKSFQNSPWGGYSWSRQEEECLSFLCGDIFGTFNFFFFSSEAHVFKEDLGFTFHLAFSSLPYRVVEF